MICLLLVAQMIVLAQEPTESTETRIEDLVEDLNSSDSSKVNDAIAELREIGPPARAAIPALERLEKNGRAWAARREIGPGPLPFTYDVERAPSPIDDSSRPHFEYILHVEETSQEIPLGGVFDTGERPYGRIGMDIDTLLLRWVEQGRLLQVNWLTVGQGTGDYMAQGNLLLLKSEELWREIFRDWRPYYSGGPIESMATKLEFTWDDDTDTLRVIESQTNRTTSDRPPTIGDPWTDDDGLVHYSLAYTFERRWSGLLRDMTLAYSIGVESFRLLSERSATVEEVAAFLAENWFATGKSSAEERLRFMLRHNPSLRRGEEVTFPIVVSHSVPPFEPNPQPIYHTGN